MKRIILLIGLGLTLVGCGFLATMYCSNYFSLSAKPGYVADDKKTTGKAIEQFHARLGAAQFDDIYSDAHEGFRKSQSRDGVIDAMRKTRETYGAFVKVTYSKLKSLSG
jgi:hypothetical protein